MNPDRLIYRSGPRNRRFTLALYFIWLALVIYLAIHHAVWRDEVRALSFALQGHNVFDMFKGLRGDGHPIIWYLILRGSHAVFATPRVLQVVSLIIAAAAMLILLLRSSFNLGILILLCLSRFAIYEYSVMARNYGISMLFLFLLAVFYKSHRDRGLLLGALLFLLANSNAHSVLLGAAFLLFWLFDLYFNPPVSPSPALKTYWLNAAIAVVGCILCALTILPTINDAAQIEPDKQVHGFGIIKAVALPAWSFIPLMPFNALETPMRTLIQAHPHYERLPALLFSLILFGSTLGLIRRPAALFSVWTALAAFVIFFSVLYPGDYRHAGLWLVFLITLYWIAGEDPSPVAKSRFTLPQGKWLRSITITGYLCFILVLVFQVAFGLKAIRPILFNTTPESRTRDLAALISSNPSLREATVIGDPDYMVEALPYYLPNQTYLPREHRFGNISIFTRRATLTHSLTDILSDAERIHRETGRPVIILLGDRLDTVTAPQRLKESYDWILTTTPEEIQTFKREAHLLSHFGPVSERDETFDAYVID